MGTTMIKKILIFLILFQVTDSIYGQVTYFPPPGQGFDKQSRKTPFEVGLKPEVIKQLDDAAPVWALWRWGHLVHVSGGFNNTRGIASLRKTIHAAITGAAIQQGKIKSVDDKLTTYLSGLSGNDAQATIRHLLSRIASLGNPAAPGERFAYEDIEVRTDIQLNCKAFGQTPQTYQDVARTAFFDSIGMQGWSTRMEGSTNVHFIVDLEDMGRFGLLMMARGRWKDMQLLPQKFVEELETKQTYGIKCSGGYPGCSGPNHEAAHGYFTWVNTDRDVYSKADSKWAWGAGSGGHRIFWNYKLGFVYAELGSGYKGRIPEIIEANLINVSQPPVTPSTEKFTIPLSKGWNLISTPLQPIDSNVSRALDSIEGVFSGFFSYDNATNYYQSYIPSSEANELSRFEAGIGYWIYMISSSSLDIIGTHVSSSPNLVTGWNLIGYNSTTPTPVGDALASVKGQYTAVYGYDSEKGEYSAYIPGSSLNSLEKLIPGKGYWVFSPEKRL
jgi:hypothetical protein